LVAGLIKESDIVTLDDVIEKKYAVESEKFYMHKDNSGDCHTVKNDGEVCGKDLPCQYHGCQWNLKPET
jgi:hypothetical protein